MSTGAPRTAAQVFGVPSLLAAGTLLGLLAALLGDTDAWRAVSWITLAAPLVVIGRALTRRAR